MKKILMCVICLSLMLTCCSCSVKGYEFYIFSDISECEGITEHKHDDAEITIYEAPDDKYLKDLEYVKFFACDYSSSELEFEIFAYEFDSSEDAKEYFKNVTGKSNQPDKSFSTSKGMFRFRVVAIDDSRAYVAISPKKYDREVLSFLKEVFSVKIDSFD